MSQSPELMDKSMKCPLCMELLGMDDVNFFPCTCGYQICCFCWHRIRTDENGLCPACETTYPEDPAAYKPVSPEELQWIKYEKKQKQMERKQQMKEYRKHLGSVRVVQRNLVFVVGLSHRLADPAVLKRPEYFGKFGKIQKVVVQKGTSQAGPQGSGACAYVTYIRSEDALQAIQCLNNVVVDGRSLKTSLGMTKYCSYFLESMQCPKPDCMYQHKLVNEAASFTKEAMQSLKHQEYEQKLQEPFNMNHSLLQSSAAGETKSKSGSSQSPRDSISVGNGDNLQQMAGDGSRSRRGAGARDGSRSRRGAGARDGSRSRRGAGARDGSRSRRGAGARDGSRSRRGAGARDGSRSRRGAGAGTLRTMSRSPELMDKSMKCPLCMELLGMDDVNFFPCTCGYQICCFCWHRIRTDENGLCPACETTYPEDPAAYKPVSPEELQWIKYEKKQKQMERKQQMKEYRKHLGSVRVVQRNLVFVVGLSHRLADPAVLKRPEYFGKFGKIQKVVVQKGTSQAGPQGSGACAYVTYIRSEDALQAIQCLNNVVVDGRSLKTSLGMTKYCSYFLESMQCPKPDCMYQHKLVNEAASFTKEAMQVLKLQEYEQKLLQEPFNMNPSLLQLSAMGETKSKSGSSQSPRDSISVGNGDNLQQLAGDGSISRHGSGAGDGSISRHGSGAGDGSMSRRGAGPGVGSMSRRGAGAKR